MLTPSARPRSRRGVGVHGRRTAPRSTTPGHDAETARLPRGCRPDRLVRSTSSYGSARAPTASESAWRKMSLDLPFGGGDELDADRRTDEADRSQQVRAIQRGVSPAGLSSRPQTTATAGDAIDGERSIERVHAAQDAVVAREAEHARLPTWSANARSSAHAEVVGECRHESQRCGDRRDHSRETRRVASQAEAGVLRRITRATISGRLDLGRLGRLTSALVRRGREPRSRRRHDVPAVRV